MQIDKQLAARALLRKLLTALEASGIAYCVLNGFDGTAASLCSDVDVIVAPAARARLAEVLHRGVSAAGGALLQAVEHRNGVCFVLCSVDGALLCLDCAFEFRYSRHLWWRADALLARRRRHAEGFYEASVADRFDCYLIKRLEKQSLTAPQLRFLSSLLRQDRRGCSERLQTRFDAVLAGQLEGCLRRSDELAMAILLPTARAALLQTGGWRNDGISDAARQLRRAWHRLCRYDGMMLVFLGADGAGKSTVGAQATAAVETAFRRVLRQHFCPYLGGGSPPRPVTDPYGKSPRGWAASFAKLGYLLVRYMVGYFAIIRPALVRNALVSFDRYYPDVYADPRRYRLKAPMWLARWLERLIPAPDLYVVLDVPAAVLQQRKQEVSAAESAQQRASYLKLAQALPNAVVIDAAQPVEQVVEAVKQATISFLARRLTQRLKLEAEWRP